MKLKRWIVICLVMAISSSLAAQRSTFTIEGTVFDDSGLELPGVTVYLKDNITVGTVTNAEGKFRINASRGDEDPADVEAVEPGCAGGFNIWDGGGRH